MFDLLQLAGAQTLGKGRDLLAAGGLSNVSRETAAGTVVYSGRVTDSFNFVDHPGMTVSADESELLSFRCDRRRAAAPSASASIAQRWR